MLPIQKLYAEYRGCVQISVFGSYGSAFECTFAKRQRDDQQNAIASSQAAQDLVCFQKGSLDIISASVESSILSSEVISNTAQVAVLETKTIESHSSDGSTVTLYDGETEDLTSVWQDIHILTLSASSGNAYTVISDQLVDYSEYMQANDLAAFAKKLQQKPEFVWHRQ